MTDTATNDAVDGPSEEPHTSSSDEAKDEPALDEEGLKLEYDVVLYGTGLVESILASALARAGKSVLHCDANDYYGSLDAVWTLPYLTEGEGLLSLESTTETISDNDQDRASTIPLYASERAHGLTVHSMQSVMDQYADQVNNDKNSCAAPNAIVLTPYGTAKVESLQQDGNHVKLSLSLIDCGSSNDQVKPILQLGIPVKDLELASTDAPSTNELRRAVDQFLEQQQQQSAKANSFSIQSLARSKNEEILKHRSRSFALDVSPGLLLAWGPAVQGLLQSSVADYVEFKSLEQLLYFDKNGRLLPVPCSKNDVFSSKLLSPMEKRRIMKFLQLALDYSLLLAEQEEQENSKEENKNQKPESDEAVTSWNERHLNQGRSLARPQNKAVSTDDMSILKDCMQQNQDFEEYLAKQQKLSPALISLVRYALALEPIDVSPSTAEGKENDKQDNATLASSSLESGMLRLCRHMQALGRFGATAFLVPLYGSGELPQAFCRSAAVYGATYLLRRSLCGVALSPDSKQVVGVHLLPNEDSKDSKEAASSKSFKNVTCHHAVIPEHLVSSQSTLAASSAKRVLRRTSILRGKPLVAKPEEQQRLALIFPPNSVDGHAYTIHGLLLDETVNVAPHLSVKKPRVGCSVLHLSTVIDDNEGEAVDESILEKVLEKVLSQMQSDDESCEEIVHISFSIPLYEDSTNVEEIPDGLHVIHRPAPGFVLDTAFEHAKSIFSKLCPGAEFLVLAKEIDNMVKERFGDRRDEDDDEKRVLESAMDMIDAEKAAEKSTAEATETKS